MPMTKFGRNYSLTVQTPAGQILTIKPPFTIEIDITRNTLTSSNVCQVRLYNLSKINRDLIRFNTYNFAEFSSISLNAGYGDSLANVFAGNISRAWSVREGVNFITQIECYDGGFALVNGTVNVSFPAGTPYVTIIGALMSSLPNVTIGAIGNFPGVLPRANTYHGSPASLLTELTGGAFYIDGGKAYALRSNEYNAGLPIIVISDKTGLLNTPVLEETTARIEMLFEPTLNVGVLASVVSLTYPEINNVYVITSIKHRGIISPVVSGDLITTAEFFYSKGLTPVAGRF